MNSKALEIIAFYAAEQQANNNTPFDKKDYDSAMEEIEELVIDKNLIQTLFLKQELKYKRNIKELKLKFIENIAFLKKDLA